MGGVGGMGKKDEMKIQQCMNVSMHVMHAMKKVKTKIVDGFTISGGPPPPPPWSLILMYTPDMM